MASKRKIVPLEKELEIFRRHYECLEPITANEQLENRSQLIGFILKLGIDEFLESKFKEKPRDLQLAKLIAQIIEESDATKIETIRAAIKDKKRRKPYTNPQLKAIDKMKIEHGLIDL